MKEESKTRPWAALAVAVMFVLASLVSAAPARAAEERTVIPMGRAVGIKLFSDGVMVVGFSEVAGAEGSSAPARDCGLREGDIITHINREEVDSIEEVQSVLQEVGGKPMSIRAVRDDKTVQLTAQAVQCGSDGQYKLGAWIRDSMAGIGTLTFCEPATGRFGALGHGINDVDTAQLMPLQSGSIMYSEVTDVKKGEKGAPGELHGAFQVNRDLGELYANTASGVFGRLEDGTLTDGLEPVPVAERKEVKTGHDSLQHRRRPGRGVSGGDYPGVSRQRRGYPEPDAQGDRPPPAGNHRRDCPGHERQPHSAKRQAGGRSDPCFGQ